MKALTSPAYRTAILVAILVALSALSILYFNYFILEPEALEHFYTWKTFNRTIDFAINGTYTYTSPGADIDAA